MAVGVISHHECLLHTVEGRHPERPGRLHAIMDALVASGHDAVLQHFEAPLASREQLARVHRPEYLDSVFQSSPRDGEVWLDADTALNPHSLRAALRAAGAAARGVELVISGRVQRVFCSVRPPGHHAGPQRAMGFCIFNNIAVGAAHALHGLGIRRVAICDFDAHHGNGTEAMFRNESRVLLCSTFQHPFYPHTGHDTANDHIVNVPLVAGTRGDSFRAQVERYWLPALDAFRPEILMVSAGFDAHREDRLSDLMLTDADFRWVTTKLVELAQLHCQGRLVSVLEGGYALNALGRSVRTHLDVLLG